MSAFVGESLLDTTTRHRYEYVQNGCQGGGSEVEKDHPEGSWVEPKYGQGASCYHCHVVVGREHAHTLPRMKWDEQEELDKYPLREDITDMCVGVGAGRWGGDGERRGGGAAALACSPLRFRPLRPSRSL